MTQFRIPLRIVFYREEGDWVAHCLEFDVMGDGVTREAALASLHDAIAMQVEHSVQNNNWDNLFSPAPGKFQQMFARGRSIAVGAMRFEIESVEIENVEVREFSEDEQLSVS